MHAIIIYDVDQRRVRRVCKFLRQHLTWVQNSAFEGELSESRLARIRSALARLIDPALDSIYIYTVANPAWLRRDVLGQQRGLTGQII